MTVTAFKKIDNRRFSKWSRIVKATVYALHFSKAIKWSSRFSFLSDISAQESLTAAECKKAKQVFICQAQAEEENEKERQKWELCQD